MSRLQPSKTRLQKCIIRFIGSLTCRSQGFDDYPLPSTTESPLSFVRTFLADSEGVTMSNWHQFDISGLRSGVPVSVRVRFVEEEEEREVNTHPFLFRFCVYNFTTSMNRGEVVSCDLLLALGSRYWMSSFVSWHCPNSYSRRPFVKISGILDLYLVRTGHVGASWPQRKFCRLAYKVIKVGMV